MSKLKSLALIARGLAEAVSREGAARPAGHRAPDRRDGADELAHDDHPDDPGGRRQPPNSASAPTSSTHATDHHTCTMSLPLLEPREVRGYALPQKCDIRQIGFHRC